MPEAHIKPSILLVAKSTTTVKLIGKHLHDYFSVHSAKDAEAAWEQVLEQRDIALLICDLEQSVDSFGLLERVREAGDNRLAATPVLLLVGENDADEIREKAFQQGATDFITLPFTTAELITRVRLHANIYVQHSIEPTIEMQQISAVNVLQQLSQENYFNSRVQQELSFSVRHRSNLSLAKLKLDNMKAIIAGFDKSTAVSVVQAVAKIIQQTLRREDTLCYLGKAEFCILYPATNGIGATSGVNRIVNSIASRRIRIAGKQVPVTLSGAIHSCIASEETSLEQIHRRLNESVRQAVANGGNQIVTTLTNCEAQTYSVDRALKLIETNSTGDLASHAGPLLQTVLPLLEFADRELKLGLGSVVTKLRAKLSGPSTR